MLGGVMFAYIKGLLAFSSSSSVVIEASGVGYKIFIPANALSSLPQIDHPCLLHTSFVVREQAQTLYGFINQHERDFFEALMGVTGVGPKVALALIGHMPLYELQQAIIQEDILTLCKVPGIGKKGAERLIIEMRDKISLHSLPVSAIANHSSFDPRSKTVHDAMSALVNLGYNQVVAQNAIKKSLKDTPEMIDVSALIACALRHV